MLSEKKSMLIGCEKGYPLELFKLAMKNFKCELKKYKPVRNVKKSFRGFGGHCLGVKNSGVYSACSHPTVPINLWKCICTAPPLQGIFDVAKKKKKKTKK